MAIVIIALIFIAAAVFGTGSTGSPAEEYCRLECWEEKINKINQCC